MNQGHTNGHPDPKFYQYPNGVKGYPGANIVQMNGQNVVSSGNLNFAQPMVINQTLQAPSKPQGMAYSGVPNHFIQ